MPDRSFFIETGTEEGGAASPQAGIRRWRAAMKIVLDAMGGDKAPHAIVEGAAEALKRYDDIEIVLTGDAALLEQLVEQAGAPKDRVEIVNAAQVITMSDDAARAPLQKKDSSLVKALTYLADHPEAMMISAGNTGALVSGAVLYLRRIPGIKRPALAPVIPTRTGHVVLIDGGANVECKPAYLAQFGLMGSIYMQKVMGIAEPRVALVNNGSEPGKGSPLTKEAYKLLQKMPIRFVGNVEGHDLLSGTYDVLVTDGFTGNIVLKFVEGCTRTILGMLKEYIADSFSARLGSVFMKDAFDRLRRKMNYKEYGGALLLGLNSAVMKAHGSSDAKAICAAIGAARMFLLGQVVDNIRSEMSTIERLAQEKAARKAAEAEAAGESRKLAKEQQAGGSDGIQGNLGA